jgi:uncharacterized protein YfaS (alpha-2-macroglobulin family)
MGTGEASLRTSLPLLVKPVFPKKLRPGDEADAVGLVQNLTGTEGTLRFSVETIDDQGVLTTTGQTQTVLLENGDSRRMAIRVRAEKEGKARLRWRVRLQQGESLLGEDAAELPVEVLAEAKPRDWVARTGRLAPGEKKPLALPLPREAAWPQAELAVHVSEGLLGVVGPAIKDLLGYPFHCAEQTASRIMALALAPNPSAELTGSEKGRLWGAIEEHLSEFPLLKKQGIGFWPRTQPDLFATAWMVLALTTGASAGVPVSTGLRDEARAGLVQMLSDLERTSLDDVTALSAFALLEAGGDLPEPWKTRVAGGDSPGTTPFAQAMVILARHALSPKDARLRPELSRLSVALDEGSATARVLATTADGLPTPSTVVAQAALLWAFARVWPDHPVIAKLTTTLLSLRRGPAWESTFENAMALLALSALGALREGPSQGMVSLAFAGQPLLDKVTLPIDGGALTRQYPLDNLMKTASPVPRDQVSLMLSAERGLWYTVTLSHVPIDADGAADHGIGIAVPLRTRVGALGTREPILEGEIVALDVTLQAGQEVEHVAVDVPLPAGFAPYELDLAERAKALPSNLKPERQLDVANIEMHPDRVRVFIAHLPHGLPLRYSVYAIAQTAGVYASPGASAQAMYAPGTRGRSLSRQIRILSHAEAERHAAETLPLLGF